MELISGEGPLMEGRRTGDRVPGEGMPGNDPRRSAVGARRIELEVRELVFHGFSAAEARRIAASLEEGLREYLATELSGGLLRDVEGELTPRLAEGIRKALGKTLGDHRSSTDRREHHGT